MPTPVFALIIGIDIYQATGIRDLNSCVKDARQIRRFLIDDLNVPRDHICLLLDDEATKLAIEDAFMSHLVNNTSINRGDAIVIYFAGHGSSIRAPKEWFEGDSYSETCNVEVLCPHDHDTDQYGIPIAGISDRSMHAVIGELAQIKGNNITFIADCCFSPPMTRNHGSIRWTPTNKSKPDDLYKGLWLGARGKLHIRGLGFYTAQSKTHVVLSACSPGGKAVERKPGGIFTRSLLQTAFGLSLHRTSYSLLLDRVLQSVGSDEQRPVCVGAYLKDRIVFDGVPFFLDARLIPLSIIKDSELSLHLHNYFSSLNPVIATVVVTEAHPTWCMGRIDSLAVLQLTGHKGYKYDRSGQSEVVAEGSSNLVQEGKINRFSTRLTPLEVRIDTLVIVSVMARIKEWVWDHYHQDSEKCNGTHYGARCKFCTLAKLSKIREAEQVALLKGIVDAIRSDNILLSEAKEATTRTTGKIDVLQNHLIQCQYCPEDIKQRARSSKAKRKGFELDDIEESTRSSASTSESLRVPVQSQLKKQKSFTVVAAKALSFNPERQEAFHIQLLRAFVSAGWSFNTIEDVEVMKLFHDFCPGARLPGRDKLSGKILGNAVTKFTNEMVNSVKGGLATISCDGWKDISKKHLIAFMFTANRNAHLTRVYDQSAKRKTGDNLAVLMKEEIKYLRDIGLRVIGLVGDAGPDERRARRLVQAEEPHILIADCWSHQIPLILADYKKGNPALAIVMDEGGNVVKWFNNHSIALGMLDKEQKDINPDGKVHVLIFPIITRWTAWFCALARLLLVRRGLEITSTKYHDEILDSVGRKARDKDKARIILRRVKDDSWWEKVAT
ncbi:hypothetical protein H0H81_006721 [Sphagnurus paluster]|uniref:Uncharacterized protein n=1 Tax=Sphagnurus paluster TaxID=117069 RepID=A0A9P7G262_9AGAR|nr:hypothetical protein H0H81_006721 [Sphagnurus paluster]